MSLLDKVKTEYIYLPKSHKNTKTMTLDLAFFSEGNSE